MQTAVTTIKGTFLFGETRSTRMTGHVKNTRCALDKLGGVRSSKSASSVWEREKAGFLLGLPLQVLPLHHPTALGASVSESSFLSAARRY